MNEQTRQGTEKQADTNPLKALLEKGSAGSPLVCAEVAGEVFGLSNETIYSYGSGRNSFKSKCRSF